MNLRAAGRRGLALEARTRYSQVIPVALVFPELADLDGLPVQGGIAGLREMTERPEAAVLVVEPELPTFLDLRNEFHSRGDGLEGVAGGLVLDGWFREGFVSGATGVAAAVKRAPVFAAGDGPEVGLGDVGCRISCFSRRIGSRRPEHR